MTLYLPNADRAYIEPAKVRDYLLVFRTVNDKSAFFQRFGFRREHWQILQEALLQHCRSHPVSRTERTSYGVNYVVEGTLQAADGRLPMMRSVWEIAYGGADPRLITVHPGRRRR